MFGRVPVKGLGEPGVNSGVKWIVRRSSGDVGEMGTTLGEGV